MVDKRTAQVRAENDRRIAQWQREVDERERLGKTPVLRHRWFFEVWRAKAWWEFEDPFLLGV